MLFSNFHCSVATLAFVLISLAPTAVHGVFYIVQDMTTDPKPCGIGGVQCCYARTSAYYLYSAATIPGSGHSCGIPGKKEGGVSGTIGSCKYGDFQGLGNKWAFCKYTTLSEKEYLKEPHTTCHVF